MALQPVFTSKDEIPDSLREHYVEHNGEWRLEVPGMRTESEVEKTTLAMTRSIADKLAALEKKNNDGTLSDDDLDKAAERLMQKMQNLGLSPNGGGPKDGDKDGDRRVADLERELAATRDRIAALDDKAAKADAASVAAIKSSAISESILATSPRKESAATIKRVAEDYFEVAEDGSVKSIVGCEFGTDLTPDEVFAKMKTDPRFAPFWPASKGGGSGGGSGDGGDGGGSDDLNPWTRAGWSITEQMRIRRTDAERAKRLAASAGVPVLATRREAEAAWK